MPWNCLCSAKEKRKLEISAPILNTDDTHNLQLVPLGEKLYSTQSGRHKIDQTQKILIGSHTVRPSDLTRDKTAVNGNCGELKLLKKKRQKKQSSKDIIETQPLVPKSGIEVDPSKTRNFKNENGKISKQLVSVRFSLKNGQDNDFENKTQQISNGKVVCGVNNGTIKNSENVKDASSCRRTNVDQRVSQGSAKSPATESTRSNDNIANSKINENVNRVDVEAMKKENAGNYDEIPLIRIEDVEDTSQRCEIIIHPPDSPIQQQRRQELPSNTEEISQSDCGGLALYKNDESIPFIDDEVSRSPRKRPQNDHSNRFITLHPQNIGSVQTISKKNHNEQVDQYIQLTATVQRKTQSTATSIQIHQAEVRPTAEQQTNSDHHQSSTASYDSVSSLPLPAPIRHEFQLCYGSRVAKLCQVCHESLLLKPNSVIKCRSCSLTCHEWCIPSMPNVRYLDTSLIIFRRWKSGHEKCAFPNVYRFLYGHKPKISVSDHHLTDGEISYADQSSNKDDRKKVRRRTRSLGQVNVNDNIHTDDDFIISGEPNSPTLSDSSKEEIKKAEIIEKNQILECADKKDDQNNNRTLDKKETKLEILETTANVNIQTVRNSASSDDSFDTRPILDGAKRPHRSEGPTSNQVVVDVHHRPNSEVLIIKEPSDYTKDTLHIAESQIKDNGVQVQDQLQIDTKVVLAPIGETIVDGTEGETTTDTTGIKSRRNSRDSNSSFKSVTSTIVSSSAEIDRIQSAETSLTVNEEKYGLPSCNSSISITSKTDLSTTEEDDTDDYATIDLRQTNIETNSACQRIDSKANNTMENCIEIEKTDWVLLGDDESSPQNCETSNFVFNHRNGRLYSEMDTFNRTTYNLEKLSIETTLKISSYMERIRRNKSRIKK